MTAPRQVIPGRFYFITRRVSQREFQLRPDPELNQIYAYCLAEAAERFDIELLTATVLSNHHHTVVYDGHGREPAFREHLNKMLAKSINALRGRWENLWSSDEGCTEYLPTLDDVFDKIVYTLANPLAANLVDRVQDWPGFSSFGYLDGRVTEHTRPRHFFKKDGKRMPKKVKLRFVLPRGLSEEAAATWADRIRAAVEVRERRYRELRHKNGTRILGRKGVLATSPFSRPAKETIRRKPRPHVSCKYPERLRYELLRLLEFRFAYRQAFVLWSTAKDPRERESVIFPAGTYRLRLFGAPCEPFPS